MCVCVCVESLALSIYEIMLSANKDIFTSSFPVWMLFISSSYIIVLTVTSSTELNKICKSGHLCLIPDLRGKVWNGLSYQVLCYLGAFHIWLLLCWGCLLLFLVFLVFLTRKKSYILSHGFFASIEMIMWTFFLCSVNVLYYMYWFSCVEPSLHPIVNPTWSRYMILLICGWIRHASILLRILIFSCSVFVWLWC